MKSVGERIRQAREFRRMSGDELARLVGYKHQSGIGNIENRATGTGGNRIVKIAKVLDFSLHWFLSGPDTDNMNTVQPFDNNGTGTHELREPEPPPIVARPAIHRGNSTTNPPWPFKQVSPDEYATLSHDQQTMIEGHIRGLLHENKTQEHVKSSQAA